MLIKLLTEARKGRENSSAKRDSFFPAGGRVLTASTYIFLWYLHLFSTLHFKFVLKNMFLGSDG